MTKGVPWFGYAPAEKVTSARDVVLNLTADHDIDLVTDELWMDVIAEGKFSRRIGRQDHGTRVGGQSHCGCFLCCEWRDVEKGQRVVVKRVRPIEDPNHPIHRNAPKSV